MSTDEHTTSGSSASEHTDGQTPTDDGERTIDMGLPTDGPPVESEAASAGQASEQTPDQQKSTVLPESLRKIQMPLLGRVSPFSLGFMICACAVVSVAAAFATVLLSRGKQRPESSPAQPAESRAAPVADARPAEQPPDLGVYSYEELMELGDAASEQGQLDRAANYYRAAEQHDEAGLPSVLLARYRLARTLAATHNWEEATSICEALRAVSRPGDQLWKHSLLVSVSVLARQKSWDRFFRQLYLLRANSARYSDEDALNRWFSYQRAMARVQLCLAGLEQGGELYGRVPPQFGLAGFEGRPLTADQIVVTTGKYGGGALQLQQDAGELRFRSEGAPLGAFLAEVERVTGMDIDYRQESHFPVIVDMKATAPEYALEIALGSVGFEPVFTDDALHVRLLDARPRSSAQALRQAIWSLQEFLILYPESSQVPEAYYALGRLHMVQGRKQIALDQMQILAEEYPASPWTTLGHYIAGRTYCEMGEWQRARDELISATDSARDPVLLASAYLWAAQCMVELEEYEDAVRCFRRALADETRETLAPRILFSIAYCMEQSGSFPLEVEERYLEVRTRFPESEYGRQADYRLARMPYLAGQYARAARRYEEYLARWPAEDEPGRQACRDLAVAYARSSQPARAMLVGQFMAESFPGEPEYWAAIPSVLEACVAGRLYEGGRALIQASRTVAVTDEQQWLLNLREVEMLCGLGEYADAEALIRRLASEVDDPEKARRLRLEQARLWLARAEKRPGVEVCRAVAQEATSKEIRLLALKLMGQFYEQARDYQKAALAFAGMCPPSGEEHP